MSQSKVTSKGQVTLPKEIRQELGVQAGDRVEFRLAADGSVVVEAATCDPMALRGIIKPGRKGVSLSAMDDAIADAAVDRFRGDG